MEINEKMKEVIRSEGRTQRWIVEEMNKADPELNISDATFSAAMKGRRKVTAKEMIAFCKAVNKSPEIFIEAHGNQATA